MNREQIIQGLKELLDAQDEIQVDTSVIQEDTELEQVGFDSLSILDFMYDVEQRFGIEMDVSDLVEMSKVRDLIDYLEAKLKL